MGSHSLKLSFNVGENRPVAIVDEIDTPSVMRRHTPHTLQYVLPVDGVAVKRYRLPAQLLPGHTLRHNIQLPSTSAIRPRHLSVK